MNKGTRNANQHSWPDDPRTVGTKCESCPFALNGLPPHKPVWGVGPTKPIGVICGEGPGPDEAEAGIPFVGATGRALDSELLEAGLVREKLFICNATLCFPDDTKTSRRLDTARKCCEKAFEHQVSKFREEGRHFLPMGQAAARAVLRDDYPLTPKRKPFGIEAIRGFVFGDSKVFPTLHPTYAFYRNPYSLGSFRVDLARFKRSLEGKLETLPQRLVTEPTPEDVREVCSGGWVALDIETSPRIKSEPWTGKDPTRARIKCIGLGNAEWGLSWAWGERRDTMQAIRAVLKNKLITKVTQNGPQFDIRVLKRYGFPVNNWEDTRDARRALSSTSKVSLAHLASIYTDFTFWKNKEDAK